MNPLDMIAADAPEGPISDRRARPAASLRWRRSAAAAAVLAAVAGGAAAQDAALDPVTVTGNRVEIRTLDAPYSIGVVEGDELRAGGLMVNLSEALVRVPGLTINNRSNFAQDLQISSRGYGARSTFGVRGLRLYTDGIPATAPDGSGQVTHFDIAGAERIEVLRGPFSALYGNSSGGVIALFSAPATKSTVEVDADAGSFGTRQGRFVVGGPVGGNWDAKAEFAHFEWDGFRPQMAAQRDLLNLRLGYRGERDTVTFLVNSLDQPADDPLGLTRAQFDENPRQTAPQALQFDTRKTAEQSQMGLNWRHRYDRTGLSESGLTVYAGDRSVTQWQAIPPATQLASPRHPGGVIDFDRSYYGADARLVWRWTGAQLVAGVNVESQSEDRRGFENFIGAPPNQVLGVTGNLRRDETNTVRTRDAYAQGEVDFGSNLTGTLGVRTGSVRFDAEDAFLSNGDDSGSTRFTYTNPVASLRWRPRDNLNLYVSAGRGFESPILNELAYRPDGTSGFNSALKPQKSRQLEVGAKWRGLENRLALDVALYDARTDDEISVLTNQAGRSAFQNVGSTTRRGAEASLRWQPAPNWRATVAATLLDAKYDDDFFTCGPPPCAAPTIPVAAGNRIAGTNKGSLYAELAWRPRASTELAAEVRGQGRTPVNDVNSDFGAGFGILSLRARQRYDLGSNTSLDVIARVDNVADRSYVGSVIVNEGNSRFFETGVPRNYLLGVRIAQTF